MENGLTEEKISELDGQGASFSPREALAVEFAERLATDHHNIDDDFFDRLREQFSEPEILELGMMAGQYIGFGRLLMVLDLTPKYCPADGEGDLV
jgi:alkylhydroperoxidase family enzyme